MDKLQIIAVALALIYLVLVTSKYSQEHPQTIEVKTPKDVREVKKMLEEEYKQNHPEQF